MQCAVFDILLALIGEGGAAGFFFYFSVETTCRSAIV